MNKNKIFSIAIGFCLLGTAGYAASKRSKDPFTVALDCETDMVSWAGVPSNAGSIALFGISDTQKVAIAVVNIPATRSMIIAVDTNSLPIFLTIDTSSKRSYNAYGEFEIAAFAIQDPILVEKGKGHNNPSPTEIRDLAASKALESTSIKVKCQNSKIIRRYMHQ